MPTISQLVRKGRRVLVDKSNVLFSSFSYVLLRLIRFCFFYLQHLIGDRCQNICEFIFYYVKGQDFRHVGGDELDKLLAGKDSDK